jgi:nucleotide-binding universal stress UspA family protein
MFKNILLKLDGRAADRQAVEHVKSLAKLAQGRVILLQVDGPGTKAPDELEHLRKVYREFLSAGIPVELELACGDPIVEIVKQAEQKGCDLIALARGKRRSFADCIFGTVASRVQRSINLPVLLLWAEQASLNAI